MNKTVFVGNLAWSTTSESLKTLLETVAPVETVAIQTHNDTGRSKGWALATFETRDGMEAAIQALSGREVEGRSVFIREDRTTVEKEEGFVVFVGNIPWDCTPASLREIFGQYSPYDVHIKTNMSGRSRGFGLLRFRTSDEAQRVIEEMHGAVVKERKILVRLDRAHLEMMGKAPPPVEMSEMVTVGNIPWHTGDDVLACHFATAGRLISCQIQRHADTLRSKGWAIIRYLTPEEGGNAIRTLHRTVLDGRTLNVRFYKPGKANSVNGGNPDPPHFSLPYTNGNGTPMGMGVGMAGLAPGLVSTLHPAPPQGMHEMMLPQGNGHAHAHAHGAMMGYGDMYHHAAPHAHAAPMQQQHFRAMRN